MAAFALQTCSVCGAVLSEPSNTASPKCPSCLTKELTERQGRGIVRAATLEWTMIASGGSDTEQEVADHAMTVDFALLSDPDKPGACAAPDFRPAKQVEVGRFQVTSMLGRGSFGTVYRAYDPLLDREVALKVPRFAPDDRSSLERFHREAKAAARLHHPNIVALHESGQANAAPYLVVEFVDGVPLSQMLRKQRLDLRTIVDWVRQIAEGLHYAHSEGIIHRDVKPANIMVNRAGRPLVMDFGLAKRDADIESGMTVEGQIVGTPNYMSPEQARGAIAEIGAHSDQYSVGVVLYEMLCGRPPFVGDPWSIISHVASVRDVPPSPRSLRADIPRDLEACCLKAMEKDPKARYPSLQALADDLEHWLQGLPLVARPIGPVEQLVRWCRQNRLIAGLGGALVAMIVTAAIIGNWLAFRFQELATVASKEANDAKDARELEKHARLATDQARELEKTARLNAERVIVDAYTEFGLTADRNGDPREAILWFANAVAASESYPLREKHNRIRWQSWLSEIAVPVRAFEQPASWNKGLSYHPSGNLLLSLSLTGECDLLRLSDSARLKLPVAEPINAATWSPDGARLVVASGPEVMVFEFPSNTELDRWTHPDSVNCLQFSANGELLVVGGTNTVRVRDVPQKSFRTGSLELGSPVLSTAIASDGRRFAVRCEDKQVRVFSSASDQPSSDPLLPTQPADSGSSVPPMFVGNDRLIVIDNARPVRCWDLNQKEIVWEQKLRYVFSSAMSPDGKWIALGEDFDVVLLDAMSGKPAEKRLTHPNLINNISFHPQSSLMLTAGVDHTARLFEVPSGKPVGPPIPHSNAVHRCVWSPEGTAFATVQWDGQLLRVWKRSEPRLSDFAASSSARSPFMRFNQPGDRWLSVGFDSWRDCIELEVLDATTGRAIGPKLIGPGMISDADFIPQSPLVVLAGGGSHEDARRSLPEQEFDGPGFVRFVNSETGEAAFADVRTPSQAIAVRSSPDGQTIVVLCHRGQVLLLDGATGKPRAEHPAFGGVAATHGYLIRDRIRFSPLGDQFVLWGCNAEAELRRTTDGERLFELRHDVGFIHDAPFSPDGRLVATCSSDHNVRLWNTATGDRAGPMLHHSGWVFSAQFSRDGQRLLTASSDKQARIWDVATGIALLATREHADQVFGATFLPGEELFLVSTRDGQLTAWDTSLGKMIAPARHMPGMVYQLTRSDFGPHVIASGGLNPARGFNWSQWILEPDTQLSREDIRLLGEILSSQRIHEQGAATGLTSAQWLNRWTQFQEQHPDYPALKMPVGSNHERRNPQ